MVPLTPPPPVASLSDSRGEDVRKHTYTRLTKEKLVALLFEKGDFQKTPQAKEHVDRTLQMQNLGKSRVPPEIEEQTYGAIGAMAEKGIFRKDADQVLERVVQIAQAVDSSSDLAITMQRLSELAKSGLFGQGDEKLGRLDSIAAIVEANQRRRPFLVLERLTDMNTNNSPGGKFFDQDTLEKLNFLNQISHINEFVFPLQLVDELHRKGWFTVRGNALHDRIDALLEYATIVAPSYQEEMRERWLDEDGGKTQD